MVQSALTYISVFTSLKERPLYNALVGLAWGVGAVLGPVLFCRSMLTLIRADLRIGCWRCIFPE